MIKVDIKSFLDLNMPFKYNFNGISLKQYVTEYRAYLKQTNNVCVIILINILTFLQYVWLVFNAYKSAFY